MQLNYTVKNMCVCVYIYIYKSNVKFCYIYIHIYITIIKKFKNYVLIVENYLGKKKQKRMK